jgi:membrane-associated phospholipid phosphatase
VANTVAERLAEPDIKDNSHKRFHRWMAYTCAALVVVAFAGCWLTGIHSDMGVGEDIIVLAVVLAILSPLPLYWHEKQRIELRESALALAWEAPFAVVLPYLVLIAARLNMPLRDSFLGRADQALGVSVPAMMAWAHHNWLGRMIDGTYFLLVPLLGICALAPGLAGKLRNAREFLIANLAAFAIGLPLFALVPAIGPWHYYHTLPTLTQGRTEAQLLALRLSGNTNAAGLVCFPSFHVIWAILCAAALWGFRPLRIPIALLSGMIILSTMTTGWHYFTDVLAGLIVAGLSLGFARFCTNRLGTGAAQYTTSEDGSLRSEDAVSA